MYAPPLTGKAGQARAHLYTAKKISHFHGSIYHENSSSSFFFLLLSFYSPQAARSFASFYSFSHHHFLWSTQHIASWIHPDVPATLLRVLTHTQQHCLWYACEGKMAHDETMVMYGRLIPRFSNKKNFDIDTYTISMSMAVDILFS